MRQILQQEQVSQEAADSLLLFQKAIRTIKNDNEYPQERGELAEFLRDASTIGVKVEMAGELPKQEEIYRIFSDRHAGMSHQRRPPCGCNGPLCHRPAGRKQHFLRITNNGKPLKASLVPRGGLLNLHRHVTNLGGTMEIQWSPAFTLIIVMPVERRRQSGNRC